MNKIPKLATVCMTYYKYTKRKRFHSPVCSNHLVLLVPRGDPFSKFFKLSKNGWPLIVLQILFISSGWQFWPRTRRWGWECPRPRWAGRQAVNPAERPNLRRSVRCCDRLCCLQCCQRLSYDRPRARQVAGQCPRSPVVRIHPQGFVEPGMVSFKTSEDWWSGEWRSVEWGSEEWGSGDWWSGMGIWRMRIWRMRIWRTTIRRMRI